MLEDMNEHFFIYNGQYFQNGEPAVSAGNNGLRYGDGLFETMRMQDGRILNAAFHFERLFSGMNVLQFEIPTYFSQRFFEDIVNQLLIKNSIQQHARIRLMIFRGDSNNFDSEKNATNYIIETSPLADKLELNKDGLTVDIFPDARKCCDLFSGLKSNNYLRSVLAGLFAKKNQLDEAIILNSLERVSETAIANIFIINGNNIYTPPLSEGCVAGTMRRWMLEKFSLKNYLVSERALPIDELLGADEFFLTNAIHPIRWVKNFRSKIYRNEKVNEIFRYVQENL
jgi:branched-chain amino acid aminotransferase